MKAIFSVFAMAPKVSTWRPNADTNQGSNIQYTTLCTLVAPKCLPHHEHYMLLTVELINSTKQYHIPRLLACNPQLRRCFLVLPWSSLASWLSELFLSQRISGIVTNTSIYTLYEPSPYVFYKRMHAHPQKYTHSQTHSERARARENFNFQRYHWNYHRNITTRLWN